MADPGVVNWIRDLLQTTGLPVPFWDQGTSTSAAPPFQPVPLASRWATAQAERLLSALPDLASAPTQQAARQSLYNQIAGQPPGVRPPAMGVWPQGRTIPGAAAWWAGFQNEPTWAMPEGRVPLSTAEAMAGASPQDEAWYQALLALLGSGEEDALGWATLEQRKQEFAQSLAQQAELARLAREQAQREQALALGQAIANAQSQQWAEAMPWVLPADTTFVPGFEPGGPVSQMARMGGATYTPPRAQKAPPPTAAEMEAWLQSALQHFGP